MKRILFSVIALTALIAITLNIKMFSCKKSGKIVLLNGTSSAGKTSIIKELQKHFGSSYVTVIGDEFVEEYSAKNPMPESMARNDYQFQVLSDMYLHVKKLSESGKNVLVDTVEFDDHYQHYCSILNCNKVIKILVYCPLDVIVDRVKKRNISGDPKENRPLNLSFGQFKNIYKLQESKDEVIVDKIQTSRMLYGLQEAEQEVRKLMQEDGENPEKSKEFFVKPFIEQYKLDKLNEIILSPKNRWDLIVNTGTNLTQEVAQTISEYLKKCKI